MKKVFLFFALMISSIIAKAQGDYNFSPFGVGFGTSLIRGYTNLAKQNNTLAANLNFTYYESPYLPVTAELQMGRLSGGSRVTDPSARAYENNYIAFYLHVDLQLGEVIDYYGNPFMNAIKGVYFGGGVGFVDDNVSNARFNLIPDANNPVHTYRFPGTDHSINFAVPLRAGYEFKFFNEYDEPFLRIDLEYEHNIVFGEGLDGYDDPPSKFKNESPDQYRQISITFKYNFGLIRAYTKRIRGTSF